MDEMADDGNSYVKGSEGRIKASTQQRGIVRASHPMRPWQSRGRTWRRDLLHRYVVVHQEEENALDVFTHGRLAQKGEAKVRNGLAPELRPHECKISKLKPSVRVQITMRLSNQVCG
jgi:hypothetical protein